MKKLLHIVIVFFSCSIQAQIVDIPDPVFKWGLVNLPVADLDGNGTFESDVDTNDDGEIQESEAEAVFGLEVAAYTHGGNNIQSLEGLEAFVNLEFLNCAQQEINSMDLTTLSNLRELDCHTNLLTSMDVTQNTLLEVLQCGENPIQGSIITSNCPNLKLFSCGGMFPISQINFLDVTQNPSLENLSCRVIEMETLDVSNNPLLKNFGIFGESISNIDVSQNPLLEFIYIENTSIQDLDLSQNNVLVNILVRDNNLLQLDISNNPDVLNLRCSNNQLTYLNVNNGNNANMFSMIADSNPDLMCIQVDDVDYSNSQSCGGSGGGWCKDEWASYSEFCELGISDESIELLITIFPNPTSNLLTIQNQNGLVIESVSLYDALGRKVMESNEATESIDVSNLTSGIYFIHITTDSGIVTKKIIKE